MHPKVVPLFFIIRITKVYYLDYHMIVSSKMVLAIKIGNTAFNARDLSIKR